MLRSEIHSILTARPYRRQMGRGSTDERPFLGRTLILDDETGARLRSLAGKSQASSEAGLHEPRFAAAIIYAAMCTHNRRHEPGRSRAFVALDRLVSRRNAAADALDPTLQPDEQDGDSTSELAARAEALLESGRPPDASTARRLIIDGWDEFEQRVAVSAEATGVARGDAAAFELKIADEILYRLASRILSRSRRRRLRGCPQSASAPCKSGGIRRQCAVTVEENCCKPTRPRSCWPPWLSLARSGTHQQRVQSARRECVSSSCLLGARRPRGFSAHEGPPRILRPSARANPSSGKSAPGTLFAATDRNMWVARHLILVPSVDDSASSSGSSESPTRL